MYTLWSGTLPYTGTCRYCGDTSTVTILYLLQEGRGVDAQAGKCPGCGTPLLTTEEAEAQVEGALTPDDRTRK